MRLTKFTDFGLRALMILAGQPGRSFTTEEIAGRAGVSRNHMVKIVGELARAGFIKTRRGKGGGFMLARDAAAIRLGEVVRRLEAGSPLAECFRADGGACRLTRSCGLKGHLAVASEAFFSALDTVPLADIAYQLDESAVREDRP
ncbi:MAG: RrF2 family transcriptional regulator [Dichotomicrobium sp.]